ncbi:IS1595 family transposase, partial [Intestinibacter sp.]
KCPKCGHSKLNKNGITNSRQRYICKNCRTTFDERSFSPLSNTKLSLDTWLKYCIYMIEGGTIKHCAEKASVSIPTSFFMRHRILDVLNITLKNQTFDGLVSADIQYLNESFKGKSINRSFDDERYFSNFRRQNLSSKLFPSMNVDPFSKDPEKNIKPIQVMINTAMDRNGHVLTRIVENKELKPNSGEKSDTMLSFFDGRVSKNTILCAFDGSKYKYITPLLDIKFKRARSRMNEPLYTVNHVFRYHINLKAWIANFHGVATKYLNNYLAWYTFLFRAQKLTKLNKISDLFIEFSTIDLSITKEKIKNRSIEIIT